MVIDLRSDTVTQPTQDMRRAIEGAPVGDDVYGEDLTVRELEERGAELTGKEAGLFIPSGTMGNLLAVLTATNKGDEIIMEDQMHMIWYEVAGIAALAGVQIRALPGKYGVVTVEQLKSAVRNEDIHFPSSAMFCMENTHNRAGGAVLPLEQMRALATAAREAGLWVHTDGARIFNAATYLEVDAKELAACTDSMMFCLSKGLAAPVGSLLVGPQEFIERARKFRKMVGGGMRQAGVLAAAGLIGLNTMRLRLAEDHNNARILAEGLAESGVELDLSTVQTNILRFSVPGSAQDFVAQLKHNGILANAYGAHGIRFVTHYQVSRGDVDKVLSVSARLLR